MAKITLDAARRIALASQGFDRKRSASVGSVQFRRAMDQMSILQLDSVNVVCRSHYLPILARLGPYDRSKLDRYLYHSGEHFEYLAHVASISSQQNQPLLRHRMAQNKMKRRGYLDDVGLSYVNRVLAEVQNRGPVSIKDLADPGQRTGPWWGHSKGKVALEWLYITGQLSIRERTSSFVTVYDIPERVIRPEVLAQPDLDDDVAQSELLLKGARAHGVATANDIIDYYRLNRPTARPQLNALVASGQLEKVDVEGWTEQAYLHPEARRPRKIAGSALLSPFDPLVWFRPRAERLFNFEYRIEIYVPEPKRKYGYYVLPFLLDGHLVARVDLKADRKAGALLVRGAYLESYNQSYNQSYTGSYTESYNGSKSGVGAKSEKQRVAAELAKSLTEMAQWLGLSAVKVATKGNLSLVLATSFKD